MAVEIRRPQKKGGGGLLGALFGAATGGLGAAAAGTSVTTGALSGAGVGFLNSNQGPAGNAFRTYKSTKSALSDTYDPVENASPQTRNGIKLVGEDKMDPLNRALYRRIQDSYSSTGGFIP